MTEAAWPQEGVCAHNDCREPSRWQIKSGTVVCWQHFSDYFTSYGTETDPRHLDAMAEVAGEQIPDTVGEMGWAVHDHSITLRCHEDCPRWGFVNERVSHTGECDGAEGCEGCSYE